MFIATVQSNDRSKPHRGGMDCPTQPRAAPTGLGNILMDIVGYRHVTPTGFWIFRCTLRRPTSRLTDPAPVVPAMEQRRYRGVRCSRFVEPMTHFFSPPFG
jgi:hypothetical protein